MLLSHIKCPSRPRFHAGSFLLRYLTQHKINSQSQGKTLVYGFWDSAWEIVLFTGKTPRIGVCNIWAFVPVLSLINDVVVDKSFILFEQVSISVICEWQYLLRRVAKRTAWDEESKRTLIVNKTLSSIQGKSNFI